MSMQGFFPANPVNEKSCYSVFLEFTGANGADPAESSFQGPLIYDITRVAEGVYDIDLVVKDQMAQIMWASASVNNTSTGTATVNSADVHVDETQAGGTRVRVCCYLNGTLDDLDAKRIWVCLVFRSGTSAASYT